MGAVRGSRLKASMVSVMESKPSSLSPQASFVSCLSCHYCDCVSFEETDVNTYTAHLREAHSITRNVESLVALTLKEQQSRPEVVTPPQQQLLSNHLSSIFPPLR